MAFVRSRGGSHQLIETYREGGQVKQRVIANLGRHPSVEAAIRADPERFGHLAEPARKREPLAVATTKAAANVVSRSKGKKRPTKAEREERKAKREAFRARIDAMPKLSEWGTGAGIDYDGEYRHVRLPNVEGRREEWLGQKFETLVFAMRAFVDAAATNKKLTPEDVRADYARKWLTLDSRNARHRKAKLAKAVAGFLPLAEPLLAVLKTIDSDD